MGSHIASDSSILTFIRTPGDIANKASATGEQFKESLNHTTKVVVAGATVAGGAALTAKYAPIRDSFNKVVNKGASFAGNKFTALLNKMNPKGLVGKITKGAVSLANKAATALKNMPVMGKIVLAAGTTGMIVLNHLNAQHKYNQGQIDKKHEIIADLRSQRESVIK